MCSADLSLLRYRVNHHLNDSDGTACMLLLDSPTIHPLHGAVAEISSAYGVLPVVELRDRYYLAPRETSNLHLHKHKLVAEVGSAPNVPFGSGL